jgi:non-homologous end joining protein Ku
MYTTHMTQHALAPMPNRASTSFTLSWGLLTIPLSAYTGVEEVRVTRKEFTPTTDGKDVTWHPVGRVMTNKDTGEVIDRADVVRRAESTTGVWVDLDDDEIAEATQPKGLATVESFIYAKNVGRYVTDGLYQVRPKRVKGKYDPAGVKAFTLLLDAMKARRVTALVKIAMRGPARYALLDHDGYLRIVVTADAVRLPMDLPMTAVAKQERDLALALIDAVGVTDEPLVDTTAVAIQAYVDQKAGGVLPTKADAPVPSTDLLGDLMASIQANKSAKSKVA